MPVLVVASMVATVRKDSDVDTSEGKVDSKADTASHLFVQSCDGKLSSSHMCSSVIVYISVSPIGILRKVNRALPYWP